MVVVASSAIREVSPWILVWTGLDVIDFNDRNSRKQWRERMWEDPSYPVRVNPECDRTYQTHNLLPLLRRCCWDCSLAESCTPIPILFLIPGFNITRNTDRILLCQRWQSFSLPACTILFLQVAHFSLAPTRQDTTQHTQGGKRRKRGMLHYAMQFPSSLNSKHDSSNPLSSTSFL